MIVKFWDITLNNVELGTTVIKKRVLTNKLNVGFVNVTDLGKASEVLRLKCTFTSTSEYTNIIKTIKTLTEEPYTTHHWIEFDSSGTYADKSGWYALIGFDEGVRAGTNAVNEFNMELVKYGHNCKIWGKWSDWTKSTTTVTDESFTSAYDTWVSLANNDIKSGSEDVTTTDGATHYVRDTDYMIDYEDGKIMVLSTGSMADNRVYYIDYTHHEVTQVDETGYQRAYNNESAELDYTGEYIMVDRGTNLIDRNGCYKVFARVRADSTTSSTDYITFELIDNTGSNDVSKDFYTEGNTTDYNTKIGKDWTMIFLDCPNLLKSSDMDIKITATQAEDTDFFIDYIGLYSYRYTYGA